MIYTNQIKQICAERDQKQAEFDQFQENNKEVLNAYHKLIDEISDLTRKCNHDLLHHQKIFPL